MEYGILDCYMISFVCGAFFGGVYEAFRLMRRIFPLRAIVFLCDVLFFTLAGFFVFELSLFLGNYVRSYTLLGFGCGLFAYINTLGRLISVLETTVVNALSAIFGSIASVVTSLLHKFIGLFAHNASAAFGRFHDFSSRCWKSVISLLHFDTKRVYNVKRNILNTGESIGGNNVIKAKIRRGT